jgi:murein DD-endopeptidase MepM/ murein hydrolase activator NlpD
MARQWTVMIVSDGETDDVRQFRMSRRLVRVVSAAAVLLVAGVTSGMTALLLNSEGVADARLQAKNELLEEEIAIIAERVDTLQVTLDSLVRKDEYYRLLAGIQPLNEELWLVGIGGPDADSMEANALYRADSRTGRRAFSVSMQLNTALRRARLLEFSWREAEDSLSDKQARLSSTPSIYPTTGYVSSTFTDARWHPILNEPRPHAGIDIVAPHGTPVVASARGRVIAVTTHAEFGLLIEIDHGRGVITRYAHLESALVHAGQSIERGQNIGAVGASGLAIGPHLHYEVVVNGQAANPRRFILDMAVIPD